MKRFLISLLVFCAAKAFAQQAPSFAHAGAHAPFAPANCEISWNAPTNQMPETLWVYKTTLQHFSDEGISNLVALGSFTMRDKKLITDKELAQVTAEERSRAENMLVFEKEDEMRSLTIIPADGYIFYRDRRANEMGKPIEDVPSEVMVEELGLKLLAQIGIPRSELAKKRNSSDLLTFRETGTRGHFDEKRKPVKEIDSRGVFFIRQIDGVTFAGISIAGGCHINFASHAKLEEFNLTWRNLQHYKKYEVASPDQIIQWIKDGKAVMPAPNVNPAEIKRLTITEISPQYMGESGEERQDFTYPFANLGTIADTGQTNIGVQLYCPILSASEVEPYPLQSNLSSQAVRAEKRFDQVRVGMTRAEVERLLGPASSMLMSDSPESMLSWSATPDRPPKRWLNVYFGPDGRVVRVEHMPAASK